MQKYFEKFPTITYNRYECKNLMVKTQILKEVYNRPEYFSTFEIFNDIKADYAAYKVYGDPYFSWLVYMSNDIVDPYYQWKLSQYDFDNFIKKKYGSIENAKRKVSYWMNNWYEDPHRISPAAYNAYQDYNKKYYEPVFSGQSILEYKRKENDWSVNTNEVWEYTVTSNASLAVDENVEIKVGSNVVSRAQVLFSNSSLVRVNHVFDQSNTQSGTIRGLDSNISANITSASLVSRNIPIEERSYWSPITNYDIEDIKNGMNQTVRLLANNHAMKAALELKRFLAK